MKKESFATHAGRLLPSLIMDDGSMYATQEELGCYSEEVADSSKLVRT